MGRYNLIGLKLVPRKQREMQVAEESIIIIGAGMPNKKVNILASVFAKG